MVEIPKQQQSTPTSPSISLDTMLSTVEASALRTMAARNKTAEAAIIAGVFATVLNKLERAIGSFTLAIESDPSNVVALLLRADVFHNIGDKENELKDLRACYPLLSGRSQIDLAERIQSLEGEESKN